MSLINRPFLDVDLVIAIVLGSVPESSFPIVHRDRDSSDGMSFGSEQLPPAVGVVVLVHEAGAEKTGKGLQFPANLVFVSAGDGAEDRMPCVFRMLLLHSTGFYHMIKKLEFNFFLPSIQ